MILILHVLSFANQIQIATAQNQVAVQRNPAVAVNQPAVAAQRNPAVARQLHAPQSQQIQNVKVAL